MPDGSIEARIHKFACVFHSYLCRIPAIDTGLGSKRHRKILLFSILEALATARYPTKGPGEALASFLVNYCGWVDGNKVSLPHLVASLERTAKSDFDSLRNFAFSELKSWGSGGPLGLDRDPELSAIQRQWPRDSKKRELMIPELNLELKHLQHRNLVYGYRSKLSHEYREPTVSFENPSDTQPFYESMGIRGNQFTEWQLVYPESFLMSSGRTGIERLKDWLLAESKDPYEQFPFGRFLIEKLNDPKVTVHHMFRQIPTAL